MRGCNEARPDRNWGEQGLELQRPSAESAKTRGANASEPAALKVQLGAVGPISKFYCSANKDAHGISSSRCDMLSAIVSSILDLPHML